MSLLKQAIRSHLTLRSLKPHHSLIRQSPKHFCTETPPQEPPQQEPSQDQGPSPDGSVYAKLTGNGISRHTLKSDIINLLKVSGLSHNDVKFSYAPDFAPTRVMIKFPSAQDFTTALRTIKKQEPLYRCNRVGLSDWNQHTAFHDGKTLLLQGIPRNALLEDVERFLCGCAFDPSTIQMFMRNQRQQAPVRMALVRFHTQADAMNALITKHRGFCLNNQVSVLVLH